MVLALAAFFLSIFFPVILRIVGSTDRRWASLTSSVASQSTVYRLAQQRRQCYALSANREKRREHYRITPTLRPNHDRREAQHPR